LTAALTVVAEKIEGITVSKLATAWSMAMGMRQLRKGNAAAAVERFNNVIGRDPRDLAAHINRGVAYQMLGRHADAIDDFNLALALVPGHILGHRNRGVSRRAQGDFDRAFEDHKAVVALSPYYAPGHADLAADYVCTVQHALAIDSATTALRLAPNVYEPLQVRGVAHYCRGDFKAAAADIRAAFVLKRYPMDALLLYLAQSPITDTARDELTAAARIIRHKDWPVPVIPLYLGQSSVAEVLAAATKPLEAAEARFFIGHFHLQAGQRDEAMADFKSVLTSCPPAFNVHIAATADLKRLAANR
jgi:lipoprotein NlpI